MPTIFVLNGPNLNLLGVREPATYGYDTLADVEQRCSRAAAALDLTIEFRQTNHEGQLVDWIQEAREAADGIVLNAGALTHTSVAVLDALNAADLPVIEVHLSNIFRRESLPAPFLCQPRRAGVIFGLGPQGYELALEALASLIEAEPGEAAGERIGGRRPPPLRPMPTLIRTLAALLAETGLSEIEYAVGDHRIRVARESAGETVLATVMRPGARRARRSRQPSTPTPKSRRPTALITSRRRHGADGRHRLSRAPARRAAFRQGRRYGRRGPDAADHRGDEGDEPDPRAARRAASRKSWSRTPSRSNTARALMLIE